MTPTVPLSDVDFDGREEAAVLRVLRSRWLTQGDEVRAFEEEVAAFTGAPHAIAVASATAGLELALDLAEIVPGDGVVVPTLTFVATANAARRRGADVLFADAGSAADWNVTPATIRAAAARHPRPRALFVVHLGGAPAEMPAILDTARELGLAVIEDAAHALGSTLDGRACGTFGQTGVYSFFSNKNLVTGEGGMIVAGDAALAAKARLLRSHGMTAPTLDRHRGRATGYDVELCGTNARMDEMRAALGRAQLAKLAPNNERRAARVARYRARLAERLPEVEVPFAPRAGAVSAHHLLLVLLPEGSDRERVRAAMTAAGVQTSVHYPPVHLFSAWRDVSRGEMPVAERIAPRILTLPLFPTMAEEDVDRVVEALAAGLLG